MLPMTNAELLNLRREHPHNLWLKRFEIFEEYGIDVEELEGIEFNEGLSLKPIEDVFKLIIWCYSSPLKAILTSVTVFTAAIHFGWITIPPLVFIIGKWVGVGMVATSGALAAKEIVIKINGKLIK
ncbi:hypothetical protein CN918_27075 [Priestia megaterium]|nr:hypothetical protein CN918_27075 [Priestia megaterium]